MFMARFKGRPRPQSGGGGGAAADEDGWVLCWAAANDCARLIVECLLPTHTGNSMAVLGRVGVGEKKRRRSWNPIPW